MRKSLLQLKLLNKILFAPCGHPPKRFITPRTSLHLTLISLAAVLALAGVGNTPVLEEAPNPPQALTTHFLEYWGYRKLADQVGLAKAREVAKMIDESAYPELVRSIISVESNWDPFALSSRNARGLMQIRMIAAREVAPEVEPYDLYDPILNVRIGIEIFEEHMDYFLGFDEPKHWALTSYNRGRRGTFALNMNPPRTRYSQKVLKLTESIPSPWKTPSNWGDFIEPG